MATLPAAILAASAVVGAGAAYSASQANKLSEDFMEHQKKAELEREKKIEEMRGRLSEARKQVVSDVRSRVFPEVMKTAAGGGSEILSSYLKGGR